MPSLRITLWTVCTVNATVVFLQVVCVSREVDHEWHVVKTQNGICDFNCSLAMIFSKIIGTWMVLYGRHVEDTAF